MKQTNVDSVAMVRAIRDEIYEETKGFSREELKKFFEREAAAFRAESHLPQPGGAPAPARKRA